MLIKGEDRRQARGLSDLIELFALVSDGVVLTSTGLYVAGFEFVGPDMDGMQPEQSFQIANRIAEKMRLGTGWTFQCDQIRGKHAEYCPESSNWTDPVSYLIEQERRAFFLDTGDAAPRLSRYFLSVSYEPALRSGRAAAKWMFSAEHKGGREGMERELEVFKQRLGEIESLLSANLNDVRRLKSTKIKVGSMDQQCDTFLRFARQCITGEDYPFAVPPDGAFLNQYLAADDFTGGDAPELGAVPCPHCGGDPLQEILPGKHIAVLAVDMFPDRSFAGILRALDAASVDFRFCQTAQILDAEDAKGILEKKSGNWKGKKTSTRSKLVKGGDGKVDHNALRLELDADVAASNAEYGKEVSVRYSGKAVLMASTREELRAAVEEIAQIIKDCGFSCRLETLNSVAAWLSTIPGQHKRDPRQFIVTTQNMAHMMPLSAPFRGLEYNPSQYFPPKSPPLFYAVTSGGSPYRFHPNVEDVPHQVVVGPNGSGKSTWLGLGIAQFFRFENSQVFAFDKKRTLYTLCRAMGGDFYDIGPGSQTQMCPLQQLETDTDIDRAKQLIELLVVENGLGVTPEIRNSIGSAIEQMAESRDAGRSLTDFQMAVDSKAVKEAIEFYLGGILDGERDEISLSRFCVFEMDALYGMDKKTMNGALFYIFGRIKSRLSSEIPTLVTVDEFREALSHELAAKYFDEFLNEGRKLNMAVWLVLQDMGKVLNSPLKGAVLGQCFTRVCLPNPQAIAEAGYTYEEMGLNRRDCEVIANATPKREYYVASPDGKRLISLELGDLALSFLAASRDRDRALVDKLIEEHGKAWPGAWLRARGLSDWAKWFDRLHEARKEKVMYA